MPGAWLLKDVGANGRTGELVLACSVGRLQGSTLELREKGTFQSRNPQRGKGSPAPGFDFAVGTAGRLLVLGEMLAPWNDRGPPGAFSSSVKPPHPFPPSLPRSSLRSHAEFTTSAANSSLGSSWPGSRLCGGPGGGQPRRPPWTPPTGEASIPPSGPQPSWSRVSQHFALSPAQPLTWLPLPAKAPTAPSLRLEG